MSPEPSRKNLSPFSSLLNYARNRLAGRIHFPRNSPGTTVETKWGSPEIIKQIVVDVPGAGEPEAVLTVRFRLKGMSPSLNRIFLNIPVPLFAGLPGFRQKLWLFEESTGYFQGRYEWQTTDDARGYTRSFAAQFMKKRSVPGSAEYVICDKMTGSEIWAGML